MVKLNILRPSLKTEARTIQAQNISPFGDTSMYPSNTQFLYIYVNIYIQIQIKYS